MSFNYNGVSLNSTMKMNNRQINVILDTGASKTVLSKIDVQFLCNSMYACTLDNRIRENAKVFEVANGDKMITRPCVLLNVTLDTIFIPVFPCYVRTDDRKGRNLIGLDFILACYGKVIPNLGIELTMKKSPCELLNDFFKNLKTKRALVLNFVEDTDLSCEELAALLLIDEHSEVIIEFKRTHNISDTGLSNLLLNTVRYYDIHDLKKFNELNDSMHILEKTYHEMFNA